MLNRKKRVFLDYASTTPVDSKVLKEINMGLKKYYANPSAIHSDGISVSNVLEECRERVANIAGVKKDEVIFTSSGTESDNMAITGVVNAITNSDLEMYKRWKDNIPEVVTTNIEHPAVIETCENLERGKVVYIPVMENGKIDTSSFKKYLTEDTILVSVILVNNEIGTIQSLRDISKVVKKYKNEVGRRFDEPPYIHTDASQVPLFLDIHLDRLGVHLMTLDGSKIYGPKGVGCLIKKSYVPMKNILHGGGQEYRLRPGTENTPLIIGFAKALELAEERREKYNEKLSKLQKYFVKKLEEEIPEAKINGSLKDRVSGNVNICISGINSEFAVIQLDEKGISCSAMTACKSVSEEARSYVVDALGNDCGSSSLRFSLGKDSTRKDIDYVIKVLKEVK